MIARPNVGAFVAPTTIRFVVLIGALLSTGLFMGNWLHNETSVGNDWAQRVAECYADVSSLPDADWLAQGRARQQCTAAVEARRFGYALGGAFLTLLAGLGVVLVAPRFIERRRRLRPVDSRLSPAVERFQEFVREAGVVSRPSLMTGSATLRDGFSYGIPRHYRIAVPPAVLVRWRDSATFDPLIRHELAHLKNHDVPLAWMARSMWLVVVPLLALPVVWWTVSGDASATPSYLWRAVLLATVTLLASSALLRSREHDADLRASSTAESAAELSSLLQRVSTPKRRWWRKIVAYHPSGADRLAVVASPERHAGATFVDGLTAAFLAGLTLPLLTTAVSTIIPALAFAIPATLVGMLLGATVGLGLWRQSLVRRVAGGVVHVVPVALGVLVGSALGLAASLAGSGITNIGGYNHLAVNAVIPLALCGATLIAAGLGEIFADAAPRFRTPRAGSIGCVLMVGTLFAITVWAGLSLSLALDEGGWPLASAALLTVLTPVPAIVAVGLAVATAYALRPIRKFADAPQWAVVGELRPSWPISGKPRILGTLAVGIAGGAVGTLMIIGFRLLVGPAVEAEQLARAQMFMWLMAAVGAGAALALVLLQPARGLGTTLLASPVASATAVLGFLIFITALGGGLELSFVRAMLLPSLAIGFMLTLVVALLSLVPRALPSYAVRSTLTAVMITSVLAAVASLGVIAGREALIMENSPYASNPSSSGNPTSPGNSFPIPRSMYVDAVARPLLNDRVATVEQVQTLKAEHLPNDVAADRIRTEILPLLRQMRDRAESVLLDDPQVMEVHEHAIKAAGLNVSGFEVITDALEQNDPELLQKGNALVQMADAEWAEWAAGTLKL